MNLRKVGLALFAAMASAALNCGADARERAATSCGMTSPIAAAGLRVEEARASDVLN